MVVSLFVVDAVLLFGMYSYLRLYYIMMKTLLLLLLVIEMVTNTRMMMIKMVLFHHSHYLQYSALLIHLGLLV
jgi:hypothetical protein